MQETSYQISMPEGNIMKKIQILVLILLVGCQTNGKITEKPIEEKDSNSVLKPVSENELKEKLAAVQKMSDDSDLDRQAISEFIKLRDADFDFADRDKYKAGLEVSIFLIANKIQDKALIESQVERLFSVKNQEFIAIEKYSEKTPGLVYAFWSYGETHPHLFVFHKFKEQYGSETPEKKLEALKPVLEKYKNVSYGRIAGSSSDRTYGDECIHLIYFDKDIPDNKKYTLLEKLAELSKGSSSEGNAHLSMALISKKIKNHKKRKFHSQKCVSILDKHLNEHLYNRTMQNMCREMLK